MTKPVGAFCKGLRRQMQNLGDYRERVEKEGRLRAQIKRQWVDYLSVLMAIVTVVGMAIQLWLAPPQQGFYTALALFVVAVVAIIIAIGGHLKSLRSRRYAFALRPLHAVLHILRNELARRRGQEWEHGEIKACVAEVLTSFAKSFSVIVGADCRACIKTIAIFPPEGTGRNGNAMQLIDHSYAQTFCRDATTQQLMGHNYVEGEREAPINSNTRFRKLFEDVNIRYYVANDLAKMGPEFQTTSDRKYNGKFPYKSLFVWPIRRILDPNDLQGSNQNGHETIVQNQAILGYLIVDAPITNAFDPEVDFEIGALVADAMYIFLDEVRRSTNLPPVEDANHSPVSGVHNPPHLDPKKGARK